MKRSPALVPLSRDHHHALDAARRLRRADDTTVAAASRHFLAFFERDGRRHFAIEEELLLPALDDPEWARATERVLADHAAIREAAANLATGPVDAETARSVGERLAAHVRFEERVLFELLESRLTPRQLEALGAAVEAAHLHGSRTPEDGLEPPG